MAGLARRRSLGVFHEELPGVRFYPSNRELPMPGFAGPSAQHSPLGGSEDLSVASLRRDPAVSEREQSYVDNRCGSGSEKPKRRMQQKAGEPKGKR